MRFRVVALDGFNQAEAQVGPIEVVQRPAIDADDPAVLAPVAAGLAAERFVALRNPGSGPLEITSITVDNPVFEIIGPPLPATVRAGEELDVSVLFRSDDVGAQETEQVDFKQSPYLLTEDRHKWELAKDVAAFANRRGGVIVVGVETERRSTEIRESARSVRPVRKELVDLPQHRGVIDSWIYPRVEGVDLRWYPPATTETSGIFLIEIPAQPESLGPALSNCRT